MSKQACFTFTIATRRPTKTFVFLKVLDNIDAAIEFAKSEIKERGQYDINFILIREGDAKPTDPVVWDSRNVISLRNLVPVLEAAMPSDVIDKDSNKLVIASLKVEIISINARLEMARLYQLNDKMQLEAALLQAQLTALKEELITLIRQI